MDSDGRRVPRVAASAAAVVGRAAEAHMVDASGSPVTVYVDRQFDVVGLESR